MSTPFPSPEQLNIQQRAVLEPDVQRLRELVHEAFARKASGSQEYWIDMPSGINQEAYKIVSSELEVVGWHTRFDHSPRNESSWIISPGNEEAL